MSVRDRHLIPAVAPPELKVQPRTPKQVELRKGWITMMRMLGYTDDSISAALGLARGGAARWMAAQGCSRLQFNHNRKTEK